MEFKVDVTEAVLVFQISFYQDMMEWLEDGIVRCEEKLAEKQQ